MKNPWMRSFFKGGLHRRARKGFTLIEVAVSLALSAVLLYGLVIMVIHLNEILWINMQMRNAEEFGLAYINTFTKHMRNGFDVQLLTAGFPSRAIVRYVDPDDVNEDRQLYDFRRDPRTKLPVVYVDGALKPVDQNFPQSGDGKDHFEVDENSFRMFFNYSGSRHLDAPLSQDATIPAFNRNFISLEFNIIYTREPSWPFMTPFQRTLDFVGSTYVVNSNWPENRKEANQ